MPRCDCQGGTCQCVVLAGSGVKVDGSGSVGNPYVVSSDPQVAGRLVVTDTDTVDLTALGSGTIEDPLVLTADAILDLDDLQDVTAPAPDVGDTILWDGSAWVPGPPAAVEPGTVNTGAGILGNGTVSSPIRAAVSGVWGTDPLDDYGPESTVGLAVYIDSNGQLRAEPRMPTVSFDDLVDKPASYPSTWDSVSGKPSSWEVTGPSSPLTAASGWSILWQSCYRRGGIATLSFRIERTGSAISVPAGGNIVNQVVATLPTNWQPRQQGAITSTSTGSVMLGYAEGADVRLSSTLPTSTINKGSSYAMCGTWITKGD